MATIHYVLFNALPSSQPPFAIELGIDKQKIIIENCAHIPDSIEKVKKYCQDNTVQFSENFILLYPIYMQFMDSDFESTMHSIAWLIKEQADANKWKFDRIGGFTGNTTDKFVPK